MTAVADEVDPAALAQRLYCAERDRCSIPPLLSTYPELDLQTAYEIQQIGHERRLANGESFLGYKLGLVSRAKQVAMGVAQPLWGHLSSGLLHDEEQPLDLGRYIHPRVEPELAFLMGAEVRGETANVATVLSAIQGVFPALEVLDSRFDDFKFGLADVVADNGSAAAVVLGGRLLAADAIDMQLEGMVLRRDGEVVDTAAGAAIAGHPAAAVAWLARSVGRLPAGAVVLTGGLTAPIALQPGTVVSAEFTHVGRVTLRVGD
jgi:2-keto-4-pentenoate hydratase